MPYSFNVINSVEDCDQLIRMAQRDKAIAENKRGNLVFQANQSAGTSQSRAYDLQQAQSDLTNLQNQQAGEVANSVDWRKLESKKKNAEARIYQLELSQSLSVGVNSLEREYELNMQTVQIAEADALIAAAEARKAELAQRPGPSSEK